MSPAAKKNTLGILTALATLFVGWLATVGWTAKVDRGEYDLHVQAEAFQHQRAAVQDSIQTALLREVRDDLRAQRKAP